MATPIRKEGRMVVTVVAEHRDKDHNLIARTVTIDNPILPKLNLPALPYCMSLKCLVVFMAKALLALTLFCFKLLNNYSYQLLFAALVSAYHSKRVAYAEANRRNTILERYRTGEPAPRNLWQAIHANLKLRCPVCRKYNIDPLLFGGRNNGTN